MIIKIRNSKTFKKTAITLALTIFAEIVMPTQALALTGGPAQPEFSSFTPIGVSDMVDLSSGDMNYNIPLMDVGGYPINMSYSSNVGMDQEASWVGLGWDLSVGQINRSVRGLPDDFNGDELTYENHLKPNLTVGANFEVQPDVLGINLGNIANGGASIGVSAMFNSYTGFSIKPSIGISLDLGKAASVGFNVESGEDGMSISPSASLHYQSKRMATNNSKLSANVGASYNSRQGLVSRSLSMTKSASLPGLKYKSFTAGKSSGSACLGSVVAYAEELYTPSKRVAMNTETFTVNAAIGTEVYSVEGQGQITAYGTLTTVADKITTSKAYGYANTELADEEGILDYNREKDGSFSVNSTNLPLTNYTYDIYSIQGQGVSGTYRAYRNQVGYVYDTKITDRSNSGTIGIELGAAQTAHVGVDIETSNVNSSSSGWTMQNNIIDNLKESANSNPNYEKVHYKNVGDLSADKEIALFKTKTGDYQAVRIPFAGEEFGRVLSGLYKKKNSTVGFSETPLAALTAPIKRDERQARNQAINNVTIGELKNKIGYGPLSRMVNVGTNYPMAKDHHIAEVQVIRNDGARYIYGEPLYNTTKKEVTFAARETNAICSKGLVTYNPSELNVDAFSSLPNDQYFNRITTPAYVHTHLLSSILSTDYLDRENDGPTVDDFGSYTIFSYTTPENYKWRVPMEANTATYNKGLETDKKDDQGSYVYGEKVTRYIKKIETKTHVAIFNLIPRHDGHGVYGENGGRDNNSVMYQLHDIKLFSVGEYYQSDGVTPNTSAIPIKTVHFEYGYDLCTGIGNNDGLPVVPANEDNVINNAGGKLTLKKVYFTYRNSNMGKYTGYDFVYNTPNPVYDIKGYDTWGNYLLPNSNCNVTGNPSSSEFPYTEQNITTQNSNAQAWLLSKIKLPSGGEINITYESDDYSFVQDKKVNRMYKVVGANNTIDPDLDNIKSELYSGGLNSVHQNYLIIDLDEEELGNIANSINPQYPGITTVAGLENLNEAQIAELFSDITNTPIQFRFYLNMTEQGGAPGISSNTINNSKFDYVSGYMQYFGSGLKLKYHNNQLFLILRVKGEDEENNNDGDSNPIAKAGWNFGRKYLNKFVYSLNPNNEENDIESIAGQLTGASMINSLKEIIHGPNGALKKKWIARRFIPQKSWIRLTDPDRVKFGGGARVQQVRISDNWESMLTSAEKAAMNPNNYPSLDAFVKMEYGQSYTYKLPNGKTSGVASYEPIGNKENPFVQPVFEDVHKLLAPDEENYIEKPFGESFFPAPQVTYARVSVSSLHLGTNPDENQFLRNLHKTGRVVTEFYTSRDYPVIVDQTTLQQEEDKSDMLGNLLNLNTKKHFTASQGYVIHLNDMNGKQKAQRIYAEGQDDAISGVDYIYDVNSNSTVNYQDVGSSNDGKLNNSVTVIDSDGNIKTSIIGVEIDIVNDLRQNKTKTRVPGMNTNIAAMLIGVIPIAIPIPLPDYSQSEDQFRSSSTTKVVNTFGILRQTIAYDAGAAVYTRNLAWDEETGEVLVTETIDEFNDKYYTLNYPAHWVYEGMSQAYKNLGLSGTVTPYSSNGYYTVNSFSGNAGVADFFLNGDELIVFNGTENYHCWVTGVAGGAIQLTDADGAYLDLAGQFNFNIIRSGRRNLQSAGIMNVTLMKNPLFLLNGSPASNLNEIFLTTGNPDAWWKVINAGAVEYSDDWNVSCECGLNDKQGTYNPYAINEKGVWRTKSSRTYLTGRNYSSEVTPRVDGFFAQFSPMYRRDNSHTFWEPHYTNWTKVAEVSQYSPYGFEIENRDALNRYSAALYGYNNMFPTAVGANTAYKKIGFDGFEYRDEQACPYTPHFMFDGELSTNKAHTGKKSIRIAHGTRSTLEKKLSCGDLDEPFETVEESN